MTMDCQRVDDLMMDLVYGELSPDDEAAARAHVSGCSRCTAEMASFARTRAALRRLDDAEPPPAVRTRLLHEAAQRKPPLAVRLLRWFGPLSLHPVASLATVAIVAMSTWVVYRVTMPGDGVRQRGVGLMDSGEAAGPAAPGPAAAAAPAPSPESPVAKSVERMVNEQPRLGEIDTRLAHPGAPAPADRAPPVEKPAAVAKADEFAEPPAANAAVSGGVPVEGKASAREEAPAPAAPVPEPVVAQGAPAEARKVASAPTVAASPAPAAPAKTATLGGFTEAPPAQAASPTGAGASGRFAQPPPSRTAPSPPPPMPRAVAEADDAADKAELERSNARPTKGASRALDDDLDSIISSKSKPSAPAAPSPAPDPFVRADALRAQGRCAEAAPLYARALRESPGHARAAAARREEIACLVAQGQCAALAKDLGASDEAARCVAAQETRARKNPPAAAPAKEKSR